jgi:hypothetical protein
MSLKELLVPTETFQIGEGTLTVRGLGSSDLAYLIQKHQDKFDVLYQAFRKASEDNANMTDLTVKLATSLPDLAASIVACGAGERGAESHVEKLPFPVTIRILKVVGKLTFDEYGGIKPFIEDLITIAKSTADSINTLTV